MPYATESGGTSLHLQLARRATQLALERCEIKEVPLVLTTVQARF